MLSTIGKPLSRRLIDHALFLVGGSRSGTIVLLKALGEHPEILASPSENPFMTDLGRLAYDLGHATSADTYYYERTLRVPRSQIYQTLRRLAFESSFGPDYGIKFLLRESLRQYTLVARKHHWLTKTFPGERTAQGLQILYPTTRFIWILRNGMHVVFSRAKFPEFRDQEFGDHCQHWTKSIERFAYLARSPSATVVHHEVLLENPDQVFRRIYELIGLPYHPAPTEYALHTHVHPLSDESITKGVDVKQVLHKRQPPYESWTSEERGIFKDICGDAMAIAGYDIPF